MPDDKQPSPWMQAAANTGQGALGAIIGLGLGGIENKRQRKQQRKLNEIQLDAHKKFTEFNSKEQLKMWEATNYPAQMAQLKKAGLNPALMYEGGGPGGTTQVQTGGEAGHTAARGAEGVQGMGMGLQMGMMSAQIRLMEAQAKKAEADANKTAGVDTDLAKTEIASLTQGIENAKAQQALTKVQTRLAEIDAEVRGESTKALKYIIKAEADKLQNEVNILYNENLISQNTWSQKIDIVNQQLIAATLSNELARSNITVNEAQIQKWAKELTMMEKYVDQGERQTKVQEQLANFNTSLTREAIHVVGGIVSDVIGSKLRVKGPKGVKTWESGQDAEGNSWSRESYRENVK